MSININKVEHAGLSIYAKLMLMSKEATEFHNRAKTLHNIDIQEGNSIGNITLAVKNATADEVISKLNDKLATGFWQMMGIDKMVTLINDGGKVSIAF